MKYRSRTEITAMMLQAANGGVTKTKIMYKAFISYTQMTEYLSYLQGNGLVECEVGTQLYRTTEKGFQFLHSYGEISELVTIKNGQQTAEPIVPVVKANFAKPRFQEKKPQFQF
jgi:predicted transcriptional regulator